MYYAGQLSAGTMTAVSIAQNIFDGASGTDATILANKLVVANAYTDAVDTASEVVAYAGDVAAASARALLTTVDADTVTASFDVATSVASIVAVANATPAIAGSTLALTTKTDSLAGGAGADTINGVLQKNGATGTTAAPGDSISGGADVDTLSVSVAGTLTADYTLAAMTTSSVEKVVFSNFETSTFNNLVDTSLMTGITHAGLTASSATGDTEFTNLKNMVEGEMQNGSGDLTLTYGTAVVAGTADTQTLNVSNTSAGTFTATGVETVNVKTGLLASTLAAITAADATKIAASGDSALTVTTALTQATIDASAMAGAFTITAGAAVQAITGGSGDDTIDMVGTLTNGDVVKGGLGTDTLKLTTAATIDATATTGELIGVSGFETIQVASTGSAVLDLTGFTGVTNVNAAANEKTITLDANASDTTKNTNSAVIGFTLNGVARETAAADGSATSGEAAALLVTTIDALAGFSASATGAVLTVTADSAEAVELVFTSGHTAADTDVYQGLTLSNLEAGTAVNVYSGESVTANLADASGTADHLTVNLATKAADKGFAKDIAAIVASNIETVTLNATGMTDAKVTTLAALTLDSVTTTLNVTGDSDLVLSDITALTKAATINASTFSGDLSLTGAASLVQAITTGTGNDTITMGTALTSTDVIDGGGNSPVAVTGVAGKDTLTASGAIGSVVTAMVPQISNVETIQFANAANDVYMDVSSITGASNIAFSASSGTTTLTNVAADATIGMGITTAELAGTLSVTLADETGTADSITLAYPTGTDTAATTVVKTAGIETVNIVATTESGGADTHTITTTNLKATNLVITSGQVADTLALGTLNVATSNVDAGAYKGILTMAAGTGTAMTVSALGGVANTITGSTGSDTVTLTGKLGTAINVTDASTGTLDTLNATADNASTDFTSVSGYETINLTITNGAAAGFDDATKDDGLMLATKVNVLGGNSLSTFSVSAHTKNTAANTLDASGFLGAIAITTVADTLNSFQTIKAGSMATDAVTTIIAGAEKPALMSGVETLTVKSTDNDTAASIDLANVTGLTTVVTSFITATNEDQIELKNLASGVTVKTTITETADQLVIGLTDKANLDNALTVEMTSFTTANDVLDLNATGVETLNFVNKSTNAGGLDLAGVDATATTGTVTLNVSGTGATTLSALNTDINVINAGTATGALTLAAAERNADQLTYTGGFGVDTVAMENILDVIDGGAGVDALTVNFAAILGGISVDLSSATDQITAMDGSSNTAVQKGFESVDLSTFTGFGAVIKGSTAANTITGTPVADNISGGAGGDTVTGGQGADVITLGAGADTVVFSDTNGVDTITGFAVNADFLNFDSLTDVSDNGIATAANATIVTTVTAKVYVHADGDDGTGADNAITQIADYTSTTDVAAFLEASYAFSSGDDIVFVINDLVGADVYAYSIVATNATLAAGMVTLIGQVNDIGATALDIGEIS
jgi:hypothetical protein